MEKGGESIESFKYCFLTNDSWIPAWTTDRIAFPWGVCCPYCFGKNPKVTLPKTLNFGMKPIHPLTAQFLCVATSQTCLTSVLYPSTTQLSYPIIQVFDSSFMVLIPTPHSLHILMRMLMDVEMYMSGIYCLCQFRHSIIN